MKRQVSLVGLLLLIPALSFAGWVSQNSGAAFALAAVHFPVDAQTGYVVGYSGTLVATTNGGANWAPQISGTTYALNSVHFPVDVLTGYAVGGGGTILATTNGAPIGSPRPRARPTGSPRSISR